MPARTQVMQAIGLLLSNSGRGENGNHGKTFKFRKYKTTMELVVENRVYGCLGSFGLVRYRNNWWVVI